MKGIRIVRFSVFGVLVCILWVFLFRDYAVLAEELSEDTEEISDQVTEYYEEVEEVGSLSLDSEDMDSSSDVLSDSFTSFSSLRSSSGTNTYTDTLYEFSDTYYKVNYPVSSSYFTYVFKVNAFRLDSDVNYYTGVGRTVEMLSNWFQSKPTSARWMVFHVTDVGECFVISNYLNNTSTQNALLNYLNSNGIPETNNDLYWDNGSGSSVSPTPDPDPTVTPTPTPSPEVGFEYMEQRPDLIVIIFALGVFIGIFAGTLVLRFVK